MREVRLWPKDRPVTIPIRDEFAYRSSGSAVIAALFRSDEEVDLSIDGHR